mgnify:CR=1 FL=1
MVNDFETFCLDAHRWNYFSIMLLNDSRTWYSLLPYKIVIDSAANVWKWNSYSPIVVLSNWPIVRVMLKNVFYENMVRKEFSVDWLLC